MKEGESLLDLMGPRLLTEAEAELVRTNAVRWLEPAGQRVYFAPHLMEDLIVGFGRNYKTDGGGK